MALVVSLVALAALGVTGRLPGWLGRDAGLADVPPGLLTVDDRAKGIATLGGGITVSLYESGLRLSSGDSILAETVIQGGLVSAVEGRLTTTRGVREHVEHHLDNVHISELLFLPGRATYLGQVSDGTRSLPLTIRIELGGPVVRLGFTVPGADALVVHLHREPATYGIAPALPAKNLRREAFWLRPATAQAQPAFTSVLGTSVGVGPDRVRRGLDLRSSGRTDVHVWADDAVLTVSSSAGPPG